MSTKARFHRLLASDGKGFDLAIDHGFFGEITFSPRIENMARACPVVSSVMTTAKIAFSNLSGASQKSKRTKHRIVCRTTITPTIAVLRAIQNLEATESSRLEHPLAPSKRRTNDIPNAQRS